MAVKTEKIIFFPFMAQGHIIPFLALALHLEKTRKALAITFVNTPLNISKLRSSLPAGSSIQLLEIPFDSAAHGLPPAAENCDVLPYPLVIRLLHASLSLRDPFRDLVNQHTAGGGGPVCLIGDIFFGWMAGVAEELGVFHAVFSGSGGFGSACYYSMWANLPQIETSEGAQELSLPDFPEASKIHKTQLPLTMLEATGSDDWSVFQRKNLPEYARSGGVLFNTVAELDELGLMYFKRKLGKPVWPIGPILLSKENRSRYVRDKEAGTSAEACRKWLDSKPEGSVLYISFGSMNTISQTQMMELAKALETSGKNFIWVVRPPLEYDINSEFKPNEWLPQGFEERIRRLDKGLLVQKWAPQVEILGHRSVSVFLSHCGWNSVLESLSQGVPLLGWGMAAEQLFNVKFLVEKIGVCVEVARGKSSEVRHGDLVEKIELVMGGSEKGKEMREKAEQVREMIKNAMKDEDGFNFKGSSVRAMDDFFSAAMSVRNDMEHENGAV